MINLSHLNKLILFTFFINKLIFNFTISFAAVDIWDKKKNDQSSKINNEKEIKIESPILSEDINKIIIVDENEIKDSEKSIIGIFDPEENNFNLNMWSQSDGEDVKEILKRINKLNLSKASENLLYQVLFTNAYPPKANLNSKNF